MPFRRPIDVHVSASNGGSVPVRVLIDVNADPDKARAIMDDMVGELKKLERVGARTVESFEVGPVERVPDPVPVQPCNPHYPASAKVTYDQMVNDGPFELQDPAKIVNWRCVKVDSKRIDDSGFRVTCEYVLEHP